MSRMELPSRSGAAVRSARSAGASEISHIVDPIVLNGRGRNQRLEIQPVQASIGYDDHS